MMNIKHLCIALTVAFVSCSDREKQQPPSDTTVDTMQTLVMNVQKCSRLYTSEYRIHKIITHNDQVQLKGTIMKHRFDIDLPLGERKVAIPMDAVIKTYVDMRNFSEENIKRNGRKITITLPDPRIAIVSTKINHQEMKQFIPILRRNFSDDELSNYEQQGRQQIINLIPQMGIVENARLSAARQIIPIFTAIGYAEKDITIRFKQKFSLNQLQSLIENTTTEEKQ